MKGSRTKQNKINLFVGFFSKFFILFLGFIIPRIIMKNYGSDTNGLTNTITQIFAYVALLEAGIGQAFQNSLYPVIAKDDKDGISRVIVVARRYYRKISLLYACAVLLLSLILPFTLKTGVEWITVFFYCFFEGLTSLTTFYFTAVWTNFLNTCGKTSFTNIVALAAKILSYGVKILLALYGINILFIQEGYFVVSLITLLIYVVYMKKHYSWIDYRIDTNGEKLPDRNSYVVSEVAGTIFNSTDMIVLSIFISTSISSVYSTYNMVFIALVGLIDSVYASIKYLLGSKYHENKDEYCRLHNIFNCTFLGLTTICMSVAYVLILPFVKLYTGGVEDINYIYPLLPVFFCFIQMLDRCRMVPGNLTGIAGYAKKVSYFSIIEASLNIVASLVLVNFYGIYGVLAATLFALPIKVIYVNYLCEKVIMKRSCLPTLIIYGVNYVILALTMVFFQYYNVIVLNYYQFVLKGFLLFFIYSVMVFTANVVVSKDFRVFIKNRLFSSMKNN